MPSLLRIMRQLVEAFHCQIPDALSANLASVTLRAESHTRRAFVIADLLRGFPNGGNGDAVYANAALVEFYELAVEPYLQRGPASFHRQLVEDARIETRTRGGERNHSERVEPPYFDHPIGLKLDPEAGRAATHQTIARAREPAAEIRAGLRQVPRGIGGNERFERDAQILSDIGPLH